jgi:hypothetical protein
MTRSETTKDANAGWAAASSENALLYGHPLDGGDSYVVAGPKWLSRSSGLPNLINLTEG